MKHLFIAMLILSLAGISHADEAYTDLVSANGNADITSPTEPGTPVAVQKPYDPKDGKLIERPVPPDNDAPGYNPGDNKTVAPWLPGNVSAFLDVIAYAEGTQAYGPQDGYNVMFTHVFFRDYSRHPDIINCGGGWCSDAAGRYQFLFQTWEEVRR